MASRQVGKSTRHAHSHAIACALVRERVVGVVTGSKEVTEALVATPAVRHG